MKSEQKTGQLLLLFTYLFLMFDFDDVVVYVDVEEVAGFFFTHRT